MLDLGLANMHYDSLDIKDIIIQVLGYESSFPKHTP